jgi:hypothetical protein
MTTIEAFQKLINSAHAHELLDLTHEQVRQYRFRAKSGKLISHKTMQEFLIKAGWKVVPEIWIEPPSHKKTYSAAKSGRPPKRGA